MAHELLEGAVRLEHGVDMADQQDPGPVTIAFMPGEKMAGTVNVILIDPFHIETQRLELRDEHLPYLANAGVVVRARIDFGDRLQQRDILLKTFFHGADDGLFGWGKLGRGGGGEGEGCGGCGQGFACDRHGQDVRRSHAQVNSEHHCPCEPAQGGTDCSPARCCKTLQEHFS